MRESRLQKLLRHNMFISIPFTYVYHYDAFFCYYFYTHAGFGVALSSKIYTIFWGGRNLDTANIGLDSSVGRALTC